MPLWSSRTESAVSPAQEVARVAEVSAVHAAFSWFQRHERELSELQLELAAIPAPPFGEQPRADWLQRQFTRFGLEDAHIDEIGNVIARYPGSDPAASAVALSAHIDTVFPAGTPLQPRREGDKLFGPGVSDNASGVVALLAIAQALRQAQVRPSAPLIFIGNVGEEGEGDLRGMRHIFSDPQWQDAIQYAIVVDGASSDTVVTRALGSRRYEVTLRGPGGHSWSDFGAPNPIVVLAGAIEAFSRVDVPNSPKTTFNVGVISGGTSVNSIPESATMRVDLRSSSAQEIDRLEDALRQTIARAVARAAQNGHAGEVTHEIRMIGSRPAGEVPEQARIVQIARAVDLHLQNNSHLQRASTDANIPISLGIEAVALGAGGSGGGAHTLHEWYDPRGRDLGLKRVLLTALTLAGISS
jgi:acetylornithine deacetylase/succinyl-diaminopimelate desuccinylase-like protein